MYKKQIVIIAIISAFTTSIIGFTKWRPPIPNGATVIDLGRLAQNTSDYLQTVKTAQSYVEMLKNTTMMNLGTNLEYLLTDYQNYSNKAKDLFNKAKTAINADNGNIHKVDTPPQTVLEAAETGKDYLQGLDNDNTERFKELIGIKSGLQDINYRLMENIKKLLQDTTGGNLSDSQRLNAIEIQRTMISLNDAYVKTGEALHEIETEKEKMQAEKVLAAQNRASAIPIYDPMKDEKKIRKNNYGFPRLSK